MVVGVVGVVGVWQWLRVLHVLRVVLRVLRVLRVCFSSPPHLLQLQLWVENILGPLRFLSVHIVIVPPFSGGIQHCFPFFPHLAIK